MELAEMENETEAVDDVFVLLSLSLSLHMVITPFLRGCLSFSDIIAFLSGFVPFSLPDSLSFPLTHI